MFALASGVLLCWDETSNALSLSSVVLLCNTINVVVAGIFWTHIDSVGLLLKNFTNN
jgi:hypothetical protein